MPSPNGTKRISLSPEELASFRAGLTAWREEKGFARSHVVKGLGITVQQLANLEYGLGAPSERVYLALCKKMGRKTCVSV